MVQYLYHEYLFICVARILYYIVCLQVDLIYSAELLSIQGTEAKTLYNKGWSGLMERIAIIDNLACLNCSTKSKLCGIPYTAHRAQITPHPLIFYLYLCLFQVRLGLPRMVMIRPSMVRIRPRRVRAPTGARKRLG